eukprot:1863672-Rhodomonas_salina.1
MGVAFGTRTGRRVEGMGQGALCDMCGIEMACVCCVVLRWHAVVLAGGDFEFVLGQDGLGLALASASLYHVIRGLPD